MRGSNIDAETGAILSVREIAAMEQAVLGELRAKMGVRARTLPRAMKRAGRRLPRSAHTAAAVITTAKMQCGHPKLAMMIDETSVQTAQQVLLTSLSRIDPKQRRKDAILSMLGAQAFNLIGVGVLVVGVLLWRGFL